MLRGFRPWPAVLLALIASVTWSKTAHAFERQWHLGAAGGVVWPPPAYDVGPAFGAYAAYGISDVFDLKLELVASHHGRGDADAVNPISVAGGIAYKLDVITWIPYFGLLGGYQFALPAPAASDDPLRSSPLVGFFGGLDYGFSRSFGLGLSYREDLLLASGSFSGILLLRAEYRWGW